MPGTGQLGAVPALGAHGQRGRWADTARVLHQVYSWRCEPVLLQVNHTCDSVGGEPDPMSLWGDQDPESLWWESRTLRHCGGGPVSL